MNANTNRENYPELLTANHLQAMGFTRTMSYALMKREDLPIIRIGKKKFIQKDTFFKWLNSLETTDHEPENDPDAEKSQSEPNPES